MSVEGTGTWKTLKTALEVLSSVAVIVCAVILVRLYFFAEPRNEADVVGFGVSSAGQELVARSLNLGDVGWREDALNIALLLSTDCAYCSKSLPLYRRLSKLRDQNRDRVQIVAAFSEGTDIANAYLESESIEVDRVVSFSSGEDLGVPRRTPLLMFVDGKGRIQEAWLGFLSPATEETLFAKLANHCGECRIPEGD